MYATGQYIPQRVTLSTRLAVTAWCLACTVLVYVYSGCLNSFVTVPKLKPLADTLDELANTDLQVCSFEGHFYADVLLVCYEYFLHLNKAN